MPTDTPTPVPTPGPTYHITVDMVAEGAPGDVQSTLTVSGSFTIEVEVGDDFASGAPDYADGLQYFWFALDYPEGMVVPGSTKWIVNPGYVSACDRNSTDGGGIAALSCGTVTVGGEGPTSPGWVAKLTFNIAGEACGQGELLLTGIEDVIWPALWGNDWLFVPLVLNNGAFAIPCETPTATPTATATLSPTPTAPASATPTTAPAWTATATVTPSPTLTSTPCATVAPSLTPSATPSRTASPVPIAGATSTGTPSREPTSRPAANPTSTASATPPAPTPSPSSTATVFSGVAPGLRGPRAIPATGSVAAGDEGSGDQLRWLSLAGGLAVTGLLLGIFALRTRRPEG